MLTNIPRLPSYRQPESIENAINESAQAISKIDPGIFTLNSPSGKLGRCLMNNLGRLFGSDLRYLEIGTERGVAYVSVMNGTSPKYSCVIDPWRSSWLKPDFDENVKQFLPNLRYNQLELITEGCFEIPLSRIKSKINMYFYDAMHQHEFQKKAFTYFNDVFDDVFLTIVDDFNDPEARSGTLEAFNELGYHILYQKIIPTEFWNMTGGGGNPHTYWNGLGVFLIKKPTK